MNEIKSKIKPGPTSLRFWVDSGTCKSPPNYEVNHQGSWTQ